MLKKYLIPFSVIMILSGCSTFEKQSNVIDYADALKNFDKEFPPNWPVNNVVEPLAGEQKKAIENIVISLSQFFSKNKIDHEVSGNEIIILPTQRSPLNQLSSQLSADQISLRYNALYFAKNPFSAGTFDHDSKQFLLSQSLFDNQTKLQRVIGHEMVHVNTYKNNLQKKYSTFYCIFTGSQFSPHYLSCDEMNAYLQDLKTLASEGANKSDIEKKINNAEMHTNPVIELILNLNYKTTSYKDGVVSVKGKNKNGDYQIEFPDFVLKKKGNLASSAKEYAQAVENTAKGIQIELKELRKKYL